MDWQSMSINEIGEYLQGIDAEEDLVDELASDHRKGVRKLAARLKRQLERDRQLEERWLLLNRKESALRAEDFRLIAGIDEAGRGPLAGPVTAAAVIFPEGIKIPGIDDSKKLGEADREALFAEIKAEAVTFGIGFASSREIDRHNILQATFMAMKRALDKLDPAPDCILVDGNRMIPGIEIYQETITGGDSKVNAIAAASILAKVSRDRLLKEYHNSYPDYGFLQNKGYGTGDHIEALKRLGPSPLHRFSFNIVRDSAFLHYKEELDKVESRERLQLLGEKIAQVGVFSGENLEILRELYQRRYQLILEG